VAIGIGVSALVMVMIYLPPLFPERRRPRPNQPPFRWWDFFVAPTLGAPGSLPAGIGETRRQDAGSPRPMAAPLLLTALIFLTASVVLMFHRPDWTTVETPCSRRTAKRRRRWMK
jgi:hypothetical protein